MTFRSVRERLSSVWHNAVAGISPTTFRTIAADHGTTVVIVLTVAAVIVAIAVSQVTSAREANYRIWRLNQPDVRETKGTLAGTVTKRTGMRGGTTTFTQYEFDYTYTANGSLYRNPATLREAPQERLIVIYAPDNPKLAKIKGEPDESPQSETFWSAVVGIVVLGVFVNLIRYLSSLHKPDSGRVPKAAHMSSPSISSRESERRDSPSSHAIARERAAQGRSLEQDGDLIGAAEAFRAAIREQPDSPDHHIALANVLLELRQFAEVRAALVAALRLDSSSVDARAALRWYCSVAHPGEDPEYYLKGALAQARWKPARWRPPN